ncbi:BMP family ABC transporter substrate-binding protein [Sporanaerobium hydrogeniformans]|uniref:BMP family ABC transporter substrate-binding protein n=1 Tax=Sporanaerobium hydrogeniformans TaxID=3072179 RepID=A0AC61DFH0_9FIRM|nr:BMP family ABC transporter substrate-binding protein [Sporanaerobium hydrogeniformans]PHV72014.1 BMP family ABC transporter substrate-binding protein [Sporanaerobium hydrogeniformans]
MKKNYLALALCGILSLSTLTGCGGKKETATSKFEPIKADFTVGMVTDAGTIDDKSFNQGTWEGVQGSALKSSYLKPAGTTEADYLKEIGNLYDAGFKFIVTPGYKFETSIFKAQDKYPDAKFVILDGAPHAGDYNNVIKENTVSIMFAEHEAGFTAGVAAAVELKEGEFGFIGGMEIPAVQKFNWGFQQGVNYANENLGTSVTMKEENIVYQGSFDNVAAGQQLAAQMFDKGVKAIFTAAGGVGVGAITEVKERAKKGDDVWVIGVDVDQYADGIYDEANGKSAILTSAVKYIDQATYDMIKAEAEGNFPGGKQLTFDAKNNGVGIPATNPNLSDDTVKKVNEVFEKIKSGEIVVAATGDGLIK